MEEFTDPTREPWMGAVMAVERYRFALECLQPAMRVLDVACGTGYGSAMLLEHGCEVVGADYREDLVEEAKRRWGHEGFRVADAQALPFEEGEFDAVVSFETVEHLPEPRRCLSEVRRVLKPGGMYIGSVPNARYDAGNPHHLQAFRPRPFYSLLDEYFVDVDRHGQYARLSDMHSNHSIAHSAIVVLEALGIKEIVKKFIGYEYSDAREHRLEELHVPKGSKVYRVVPYRGNWLLCHIVWAVGKKRG